MALIVLHELGHFLAAKAVGMRVERFSLFFPPTLFRVRRGETEYAIGAIPAGGYVKITGMSPEELEDVEDPEIVARAYCNQAPWKRIVVILAGPGMNLLIAFVLFWAILVSSDVNGDLTLGRLAPAVQTTVPSASVLVVEHGKPADGVLRTGDRIVAVDGQQATIASARAKIATHRCAGALSERCRAATPARLTIRRAGRVLTLSVYPRYNKEAGRMLIGFAFGSPKQFGALTAAGAAVHEMWSATTNLITGIGRAYTSSKARHEVHTIVGIAEVDHEAVVAGAGYGLHPRPDLADPGGPTCSRSCRSTAAMSPGHSPKRCADGGYSVAAMWRYSTVGIVLFAFLFINGLSNDISPSDRDLRFTPLPAGARTPKLLTSGPKRSTRAGPNSDSISVRRSSSISSHAPAAPRRQSGLRAPAVASVRTAAASGARAGTSKRGAARTSRGRRGAPARRMRGGARGGRARSRSSSRRGRTRRPGERKPLGRVRARMVPGSAGARRDRRR